MEEEEVGGRKLALACIKQAVTDLVGVVEKNGQIGSERLGVQGRPELLAEVKDFLFGKYKGVWSFAYGCGAAEVECAEVEMVVREKKSKGHLMSLMGRSNADNWRTQRRVFDALNNALHLISTPRRVRNTRSVRGSSLLVSVRAAA